MTKQFSIQVWLANFNWQITSNPLIYAGIRCNLSLTSVLAIESLSLALSPLNMVGEGYWLHVDYGKNLMSELLLAGSLAIGRMTPSHFQERL